jgi:hypothetical protein
VCTLVQKVIRNLGAKETPPPNSWLFQTGTAKSWSQHFILYLLHENHIKVQPFTGNSFLDDLFIVVMLGNMFILSVSFWEEMWELQPEEETIINLVLGKVNLVLSSIYFSFLHVHFYFPYLLIFYWSTPPHIFNEPEEYTKKSVNTCSISTCEHKITIHLVTSYPRKTS